MQISLPTTTENPQLWLLCTFLPFPCSSVHSTKVIGKHVSNSSAEAMESGMNSPCYHYSIPDQVWTVFYPRYLRVTNNWVLICLTHSFLFDEVFACVLPDFCFLHWTLPGFNHFSSSYPQTCHSSCSWFTVFSAVCPFKRIVLLHNE